MFDYFRNVSGNANQVCYGDISFKIVVYIMCAGKVTLTFTQGVNCVSNVTDFEVAVLQ